MDSVQQTFNNNIDPNIIKPQDPEDETTPKKDMVEADYDILSSLVLLVFGIFVLANGIYISFFTNNGAKTWYYSPGFFPMFLGVILILLAFLLFVTKYTAGGRLRFVNIQFDISRNHVKLLRLCLAVCLFAIYIFVLIGRIPFPGATFLYLSITMISFRPKGYPVWKIIVISAITSALVFLFFGKVASVPLP